jgi:hypothetical protein
MLYKEETVKVYTRVSDIAINNPLPSSGLIPEARFNEELASVGEDGEHVTVSGMVDYCTLALAPENRSSAFDLLNPETNTVVGKATYADVMILLHSMYIHAAEMRDNARVEESTPPPVDVDVDVDAIPEEVLVVEPEEAKS